MASIKTLDLKTTNPIKVMNETQSRKEFALQRGQLSDNRSHHVKGRSMLYLEISINHVHHSHQPTNHHLSRDTSK
jgi:hypothetical protein